MDSRLFKYMDGNAYLQELGLSPSSIKLISAKSHVSAVEIVVIVSCAWIPYNSMMVARGRAYGAGQQQTKEVTAT